MRFATAYHGFYGHRATYTPARIAIVTRVYDTARPDMLPSPGPGGTAARFGWGDDPEPYRLHLARALLVDVLGPDASTCDECHGTRKVVYIEVEGEGRDVPWDAPEVDANEVDPIDVGECVCEDGHRPLPVADFDTDYLVKVEAPWDLTRREILSWLTRQFSTPPRWLADTIKIRSDLL
jgi:hypothetical protein